MQTSLTERQALTDALDFLRGFEDDASQQGIVDLIGRMEAAITAPITDQIVLLPPGRYDFQPVEFWSTGAMVVRDAGGDWATYLQRSIDGPRPWRWYGYLTRRDHAGGIWMRHVHMVCDDFGNLVEVQ